MAQVGQQGKFLYKMHGEEFTVDAHIIALDGAKIEIEFTQPSNRWMQEQGLESNRIHRRWLRSRQECARFLTDTSVEVKRVNRDGRMGRPSQGREKRLQFSATPEMEDWL